MTSAVQTVTSFAANLGNKATFSSNELSTSHLLFSQILVYIVDVLSRYLAALGAVVRFRAESYVAIRQRLNATIAVPLEVRIMKAVYKCH